MNNREWLYSLDVADLAEWFDAEHVDATCDNSVGNVTHDSREKLDAEVRKWCGMYAYQADMVWVWLNRQAAITESECFERAAKSDWLGQHLHAVMAENRELQAKVDELYELCDTLRDKKLDAEREKSELQARVDELTAKFEKRKKTGLSVTDGMML